MKKLIHAWADQIIWLLEIDPMWFPEFGFSLSAIGWGLFSFMTDDLEVHGAAYVLPACAILLGVVRSIALMRLWYPGRVVLCILDALLIAWLWWGLAGRYGAIPMMGFLIGPFVIEMLIAARFAIPCAREIRGDWWPSRQHG